jgi:uncharacterized protein (TIGR00725 family)
MNKKLIAVIGAGQCDQRIYNLAEQIGRKLAEHGLVIICGGLAGVMEAACKGAKEVGGVTIGVLPGDDPTSANAYVDIAIATGMGIGRNIIIIRSAQAVLAVNGSYGTLSELAYALQLQKPIIGLETWDVSEKILTVSNPQQALQKVLDIVDAR